MKVRGLDHVSVTVADLDRSLAFYRDLLGLRVRETGEEEGGQMATIVGFPGVRFRYADVELGDGRILELLQYLAPAGTPITQRTSDPGSGHIAFLVADIDEAYAELVGAGVTVRSAPVTIEAHPGPLRVTHSMSPAPVSTETRHAGAAGAAGATDVIGMIKAIDADAITIEVPDYWAGVKVFYAVDPDGVTVEFVQRPEGDDG
jgi:catechol 2,3-dioxygenase-like lactoylglutathione lyase family enzyme